MAKNLTTAAASSSSTKTARAPRAKKVKDTVVVAHADVIDADFAELEALLGAAPDMTPPAATTVIESDVQPVTSADEVLVASADAAAEDAALEDMLDSLLAPAAPATAPAAVSEISEADLVAAVSSAEAVEAMMASATVEEVGADAPTGEGAETTGTAAAGEAKPKRVPVPRKHYSDKVERLRDRVGTGLVEYTVLTTADALVDDTELNAVMEKTLEIIRAMNSKEKNRASNLIEFLSGKRSSLNNVLERVLRVLDRDGYIQTGNEGNVMKDLLARPYSPASARAMGGNTISMYADLKLVIAEGKGRFVPNPDSLLLAKVRSMLAAKPAAAAAAADADDEAEATT